MISKQRKAKKSPSTGRSAATPRPSARSWTATARAVFRLAFRMTGSEVDAEDMAQETFLKAWKQIDRFDSRATFGTWLHRICVNCALDHIRARKRKQDVQFDPTVQVASDGPSPERMAESSQVSAILRAALDELTAMERSAFVLRHYEGLGIKEISYYAWRATGCSQAHRFPSRPEVAPGTAAGSRPAPEMM